MRPAMTIADARHALRQGQHIRWIGRVLCGMLVPIFPWDHASSAHHPPHARARRHPSLSSQNIDEQAIAPIGQMARDMRQLVQQAEPEIIKAS